jgi:hypothetical protein
MELKEQQKLLPYWMSILMLFITFFITYKAIKQLIYNVPLGTHPMSNSGLILFMLCLYIVVYIFFILTLKLEINDEYVKIKFYPIHNKTIFLKDIKSMELINYKSFGIGIRTSIKYRTIYRVSGNKGLLIRSKNDDLVLIGIKNQDDVLKLLSKFNPA